MEALLSFIRDILKEPAFLGLDCLCRVGGFENTCS